NELRERTAVAPQPERRARQRNLIHRLDDLLLHALWRKSAKVRCTHENRLPRCRLHGEAETRREPDRAQSTQPVFTHAFLWNADSAKNALREVALPPERIAQLVARRRVRDRIDGEVAACEVVFERFSELHYRVSPIRFDVGSERGDLVHDVLLIQHADRPEFDSDGYRASEQLANLQWPGAGSEIPVEVGDAEKCVAHAAANAPGLVTCGFEYSRDLDHGFRRLHQRHAISAREQCAQFAVTDTGAQSQHEIDARLLRATGTGQNCAHVFQRAPATRVGVGVTHASAART